MEFANSKDILRAETLGKHKGATNSSELEIARSKARSEAALIKDTRKILGRLEAMENKWKDYEIVSPFIERCVALWPNSQYSFAYFHGKNTGIYLKTNLRQMGIAKDTLLKKSILIDSKGKTIIGISYEFDSVGLLIFNTLLKRFIDW